MPEDGDREKEGVFVSLLTYILSCRVILYCFIIRVFSWEIYIIFLISIILGWGTFQFNMYAFHMFNSYVLYIKQKNFQTAQITKLSLKNGLSIFKFFISYIEYIFKHQKWKDKMYMVKLQELIDRTWCPHISISSISVKSTIESKKDVVLALIHEQGQ